MQLPFNANTDELIRHEIKWIHKLVNDKPTSDCLILEMLIGLAEQIEKQVLGKTIKSARRRAVVGFNHHREVASLQEAILAML